MPYVTYVQRNTAVYSESRMTVSEMLHAQLYGATERALHSKNFFNVHTFWTDNPRNREANLLLMADLMLKLGQPYTKEYIQFRIPKASGGTRLIEAPTEELKNLQRDIARQLYALQIFPHNAAYAYTRGRCAYDAMVTHQRHNARWFLKIDIKDFFPSITKELIKTKMTDVYPLNFLDEEYHDQLAEVAVNERGVLPQGSPLSPVISNLVMLGFDLALSNKLRRFEGQRYCYTRYADDILISCPYSFTINPIIALVRQLFLENGLPFQINQDKLRYASNSGRNWNLGLMYNQDQQITIGTKRKRELHALVNNFMYAAVQCEWWHKPETQELIGKLAYLKNIEPAYYRTLIQKYEDKYHLIFRDVCKTILSGQAHRPEEDPFALRPETTPTLSDEELAALLMDDDEPLF